MLHNKSILYMYVCMYVFAVAYRGQGEPLCHCLLQDPRQTCVWFRRTELWYQLWPAEGEMQGPHSFSCPQGEMQRLVKISHVWLVLIKDINLREKLSNVYYSVLVLDADWSNTVYLNCWVKTIYCILKSCYKMLFTYLLQYIDLYFCCVVIVVISGKNFVRIDQPPILPAPTLAPEGKEVELKGMVYSMSMRRVEKYIKNT